MAENQNFYRVANYSDSIKPADNMKIERHVFFQSEHAEADISRFTALPLERLQAMRGESAEAEQQIFNALRGQSEQWEHQAAVTLLLDKAIEYVKTPSVAHSSNKWVKDSVNSDFQSISNMSYKMTYHVYENTPKSPLPHSWDLTWSVRTNTPQGHRSDRVAGQDRKHFTDKADMEKYLNGRIKAYAYLFTEISPPIPPEHAKNFRVNGQLLPGYTVQGETPTDRTAEIGGDSVVAKKLSELLKKELEDMNEPLNIQLSSREAIERGDTGGGAWLKLPATAEQLDNALARIGAQGNDYIISDFESPVSAVSRIPLESIQKAGFDELNYLSIQLAGLDDKGIGKLNTIAAITPSWDDVHHITEQAFNQNFYEHHPDIRNHAELGEYCIEKSGLVMIPDEWKGAVDREKMGQLAAEDEKGIFTEHGYIVKSGLEWKPVTEIPKEYRIAPERGAENDKPERETAKQSDKNINSEAAVAYATAAAVAAAPFVLVSDNADDKLKEITSKLENGIAGIFGSEKYKSYLNTLSKFHDYSPNNCLLIAMQNPNATRVAGYNAWRDDFKRQVMKDEKGIKILAPTKAKKQVDKLDADGKPIIAKDGKPEKVEIEVIIPKFRVVSIFDVSQTDGEPLPTLGVNELAGSVDRYKDFFAALEKTSPVPVAFEEIKTGSKGYHHMEENRIAIKDGMSELQNLKTLIHEIAHARLHAIDDTLPLSGQGLPDRRTREVQAESIAYTVCQHFGIDTSDYSFGYLAAWSGDKQLDTLKSSLDTIHKEAAAIISEVDRHFAELAQSREHTSIQGLEQEVKATMQFLVDEDMNKHGAVQTGTLETLAVQGYEYKDGKLEQTAPAPQGDTFTIYQLKDGDQTKDLRFEPLERLEAAGLAAELSNYDSAYTAPLDEKTTLPSTTNSA